MINVIGLGYIGLPTALMFAAHGILVTGTDCDETLIKMLNNGKTGFDEEGLQELFAQAINSGICFSSEYQKADIYIIAVPTPYDKSTKKLDACYVTAAVQKVLEVCPNNATIVIESTVSPGTIDKYIRPLLDKGECGRKRNLHLAHAPERIIPGNMIRELKNNSRTIGADTQEIQEKIKGLYASFCNGEIVVTDIRTAEMTKVVENTFRDINIAFANELTKICHSDNLDVHEIISIANKHPRVNILSPGPGVGGHCISVDPWFLVGDYPGLANIILAARKINDSMPAFVLERTAEIMRENDLTDVGKVGIYGLTYKENVDDTRESPSLQLLETMEKNLAGGRIKVYDPYVKKAITANQYYELEQFLNEVELVILMVGHDEIKEKHSLLKEKIVFDTRNIRDNQSIAKLYRL